MKSDLIALLFLLIVFCVIVTTILMFPGHF